MEVAGLSKEGSSWLWQSAVASVSWAGLGCSCGPAPGLRPAPDVPDGCAISGREGMGVVAMTESMAASMLCAPSLLFPGNGVWSAKRVRRVPFLRRCSLRLWHRAWKA
eukprot:12625702-Heterocapsa_arctica.AAC.1